MRGTCHIPLNFPLISPGVSPVVRLLSAGLQLAEELAGAPVHRDDPLGVEDLADICELLVSAGAVTPLALTGTGVCLVLLGMIRQELDSEHQDWTVWPTLISLSINIPVILLPGGHIVH